MVRDEFERLHGWLAVALSPCFAQLHPSHAGAQHFRLASDTCVSTTLQIVAEQRQPKD